MVDPKSSQTTPEQTIREALDDFVGQPNTPEVRDAIVRRLLALTRDAEEAAYERGHEAGTYAGMGENG